MDGTDKSFSHLGADVRSEHAQRSGTVVLENEPGEAAETLNVVDRDARERDTMDEVEQVFDLLFVLDRVVGQANDLGFVGSVRAR